MSLGQQLRAWLEGRNVRKNESGGLLAKIFREEVYGWGSQTEIRAGNTPVPCHCSPEGPHCQKDLIVNEDTIWGCMSPPFPRQPSLKEGLCNQVSGREAASNYNTDCPSLRFTWHLMNSSPRLIAYYILQVSWRGLSFTSAGRRTLRGGVLLHRPYYALNPHPACGAFSSIAIFDGSGN